MSRLRVAFARISQETNSLSPVRTGLDAFHRTHFVEGEALLRVTASRWRHEAPGFVRNAELSGFVQRVQREGVEPVPLFSAWTVPGGPLSTDALEAFQERLRADLRRAGRVDAVMLSLHGAMSAEGRVDADAALMRVAKEAAPGARLAVTLDLHAHLNAAKVALADVMVGYRTNPHRDHAACGAHAASILVGLLTGRTRPVTAWRSLPMVLGGGTTIDLLPPMRGIYRRMRAMQRLPRVLGAWSWQSQLWNDLPDAGWATSVTTDGDPALAEALADELADLAWATRGSLPPDLPDPAEAVHAARRATWRRKLGVVCISDASDMVGAGAVGENTALVEALLRHGHGMTSYAPVRDAESVARLWGRPPGERVSVEVGGRLLPEVHRPLPVSGAILRKVSTDAFGRVVVLDLGHVKLAVTEGPPLAMRPAFYRDLGLRLRDADVCVVKSLFPFRLYFLPYNRLTLYARSRGTTDFDAWRHIAYDRPVHPKDPVADWRTHARVGSRRSG